MNSKSQQPNFSSDRKSTGQVPPFTLTPSYTWGYNRLIARLASGALSELLEKLPDNDIRPYAKIGNYNVLLSILIAYAAGSIAYILFDTNIYVAVVAAIVLFIVGFYLLVNNSSQLINGDLTSSLIQHNGLQDGIVKTRTSDVQMVSRIILYSIVSLIIGAGISVNSFNSNLKNENINSINARDMLVIYLTRIQETQKDISRDRTANSFDWLASKVHDQHYISKIFIYYTAFASYAVKNIRYLQAKDTAYAQQQIRSFKQLVDVSYDSATKTASGITLTNNVDAVLKIPDITMQDIITSFSPSTTKVLSVPGRISVLVNHSGVLDWTLLVLGFLVSCAFFYLMGSEIVKRSRDFYHDLLSQKRVLEEEYLNEQRKQITETYRLNTELKNISLGLDKMADGSPAPAADIKSVKEELTGAITPSSLLSAAQLTFRNRDYQKTLDYLNKAVELESSMATENKDYRLTPEIHELKANTLKALNLHDEADLSDKLGRNIRAENSFLDNKSKLFLLEKLVLQDISIFDNFTWHFKPGINILLGKNGYGKSHLLGLIIAMMYDDKEKRKDWITGSNATATAGLYLTGDIPGKDLDEKLTQLTKEMAEKQQEMDASIKRQLESSSIPVSNDDLKHIFKEQLQEINAINEKITATQADIKFYKPSITADVNAIRNLPGRLPILAIPDSRFINKSGDSVKSAESEFSDIVKYGAYEFLYSLPYNQVIENVLFKICIYYFEDRKYFDQEPFGLMQRVIKDLSSDKLVMKEGQLVFQDDSKFKFISIAKNEKTASFTIMVQPEDANITLPIQKISQGTFSILAICCLIYNYLEAIPQSEPDVLKRKAIVIIDELDAHIHPSWQRKLIMIFRKNFPNVQFIISAHSPMLVEGCRANEVSVLRRTTDCKFKIETISRSLIGSSLENIYSLIFEVENKDFAMLRYKELAPHLENFKKELDILLNKGDSLSTVEDNRIMELQDIIVHIDVSEKAFENLEIKKEKESQSISDFLEHAAASDLPTP